MGNFGGHALPGSFFVVYALWWTLRIFMRYYKSLAKGNKQFHNTVTYSCPCNCGRFSGWEWEGFVKIFFTSVGFTLEIITAHKDGHFVYLGNGQHATIFFFFGLSGVVDLLVHHRMPLPKGIEYIAMTLAFVIEGLLFKFHLHGRTPLDVLLHTLLLYTIAGCIASCLAEMRWRRSVIAPLARTYFLFLQGTWFWQVGFILYNPVPGSLGWEDDNHGQMMVITMMFAWHMAAVFLLMMGIGALIGCVYRARGEFTNNQYDSLNMKLIKRDSNGHTIVNLNDDSESDIEFERPQ